MPGEQGSGELAHLERLILSADASAHGYATLAEAHERGRDRSTGLAALALFGTAAAVFSFRPVGADFWPELVLTLLLAGMATLFAWRRSRPRSPYHRLSEEWRVQAFSLKRHKVRQARFPKSDLSRALRQLELDGISLHRSWRQDRKTGRWP